LNHKIQEWEKSHPEKYKELVGPLNMVKDKMEKMFAEKPYGEFYNLYCIQQDLKSGWKGREIDSFLLDANLRSILCKSAIKPITSSFGIVYEYHSPDPLNVSVVT